jgi:hypothetical protein
MYGNVEVRLATSRIAFTIARDIGFWCIVTFETGLSMGKSDDVFAKLIYHI